MEKMKNIEILQHNILYWYDNNQDIPEHEIEHIENMIKKGYRSGRLVDSDPESYKDNTGWWKIVI